MAIPPAIVFQNKIASLKPTSATDWAPNLAAAVASLVNGMVSLSPLMGSITFTFQQSVFATQLMSIPPGNMAAVQANLIATAWASAVQASTLVVAPGSFLGVPAPPTLFSVVMVSMIDAASIASAKAFLAAQLSAAQPVSIGVQNKFGSAIHDAFLMLTATVSGLNSIPSPSGPTPLMAPMNHFS